MPTKPLTSYIPSYVQNFVKIPDPFSQHAFIGTVIEKYFDKKPEPPKLVWMAEDRFGNLIAFLAEEPPTPEASIKLGQYPDQWVWEW